MKKIFPTIIAASLLILILFLTRTPHPAPPNLGAPASLPALETRINAQVEAPPALRSPLSTLHSPFPAPVLHSPLSTLHSPRSLSKTLTPDELKPLYTFLSVKHDEDDHQLGHALKSDVMDALCAQATLPIDLTKLLIQVYHDPTQNAVIRDYALQHLATLHQTLGAPPSRRPPRGTLEQSLPWPAAEIESQRARITTVLDEALAETDSSIAGTALLSLHHLAGPAADPGAYISDAALKLVQDPNASPLARITALQICGERQIKDALPLLTQTASASPDLSTRISAIGALGQLGGRAEIPLLEKIAAENNPRLKPALVLALHRVEQRLANP